MRLYVKFVLGAAAASAMAFGVWACASPLWAARGLQSAILARDPTAVSAYLDFEALRKNLKAQFAARLVADNLGSQFSNPEYAAARLRSMTAMVDSMITPQAVSLAMERSANLPPESGMTRPFDRSSVHRESFDRFKVSIDPADTLALRFERRGLSWQLVDVKLPYDLQRAFARPGVSPEVHERR